jgi:hypothetical protein
MTLLFYLRTWSSCALSPGSTRKRNTERNDSIRSMGFRKDHEFNVRCFALQRLGFRIINSVAWQKPEPPS